MMCLMQHTRQHQRRIVSSAAGKRMMMSTSTESTTSSSDGDEPPSVFEGYSFVNKRREYKQELSNLRKEFMREYKQKEAKLAQVKALEREKIQKAKAERLSLKYERMAIRAKEVAQELAAQKIQREELFQEKVLVRQVRKTDQKKRQEYMLNAIKKQSKEWINQDTLEQELSAEKFEYEYEKEEMAQKNDNGLENKTSINARSWLERLRQMQPPLPVVASRSTENDKKSK